MSDKLLMDNYLLILKSTVEVYVHGTLESSNKDIKDLLKCCLDDTLKHQEKTYDEMIKKNWYKVCNIKESEICNALDRIKNSQC